MALYFDLPVYKSCYSLLVETTRLTPHLPRVCRYTLGQDLRKGVMDILKMIYRANATRNKVPIISRMRETLLEVQLDTRLMCDLKYISEGQYTLFVEQTADISKQLAAWGKSEREAAKNKRNSGGQETAERK